MVEWGQQRLERPYRTCEGGEDDHAGLSATLLRLILEEPLHERTVLDVGCGDGRLTFALANRARAIVGIDRSLETIEKARQRTSTLGLDHVTFRCCDAESIDYRTLGPIDLVVANLCMSDAILRRAAAALTHGRCIVFAAFHRDQWKESGRVSRYAYAETQLEAALSESGFEPLHLGVEQEVLSFATPDEGLAYLEETGLTAKWRTDGRWEGFLRHLRGGGKELTIRARVIVKARRR